MASKPKSKPKAKKPKSQKGVTSTAEALWNKGGPLNGFKNIPWAISKVEKDGKTFSAKGFIRDDDRTEENMALQLIAEIGWPRPPENSWKVDAYHPDVAFFCELHETQHVDRLDFRMKQPGRWDAQRLSDKNKMVHLVKQGFYGAIVLAFNGPFYEPGLDAPRWVKIGASEVQKRSALALWVMSSLRAHNYAHDDYAGRVGVFSSPLATAELEKACVGRWSALDLKYFDSLNIGSRYLQLDEVHQEAKAAAASFSTAQKADLLNKASIMLLRVGNYRAKNNNNNNTNSNDNPTVSDKPDDDAAAAAEDSDDDDDEDATELVHKSPTPAPVPMDAAAASTAPSIAGQLVYVTNDGKLVKVKDIQQIVDLELEDREKEHPPFPQHPQPSPPSAPKPKPAVLGHK